jgi:hypothetical protein
MPDTKISALTDGSTANSTDRLPAARTTDGGITWSNVYVTPGYIKTATIGAGSVSIASGKTFTSSNTLTLAGTDSTTMTFPSTSATIARTDAGQTFTGAQTFSVGSVNGTGLDISQTWTGTGTYTGLKYNVTDSGPANVASLLLDLQVGGNSKFKVSKLGDLTLSRFLTFGNQFIGNSANGLLLQDGSASFATYLTITANATLQLGAADAAAPVAQTLLIQSGSGTDINGVAFNIGGSKSTGTGTAGLVNIQTSSRGAVSGTSQNVLATVASFGPNTLSGSQAISLLDMAQTWNTSGAPTAIKLNVTNTSSPTNSFLIGLQNNGTNQFAVRADNGACFIGTPTSDSNNYTLLTISNDFYINSKSVTAGGVRLCSGTYAWAYLKSVGVSGARFQLGNATPFGWTDNAEGAAGTFDTILTRDAANTLALRNGTSAQRFNVYNTYTSSTNYETFKIDWITTANTCLIGTEKGSSGTARDLAFQTDGTTRLTIGASSLVTVAGTLTVSGGVVRTNYINSADDQISWFHGNNTINGTLAFALAKDNSRFQFGGTTSSFPALKRSSASLICRLADDSANAAFEALSLKTSAPAGGTSGTWKVGVYNATAPSATGYVEVDINGTLYKLLAST